METKVQSIMDKVATKQQQGFQEFKNKLGENEMMFEAPGQFIQVLGTRLADKQEDALEDLEQKMGKQLDPSQVVELTGRKIGEAQQKANQEFAERWQKGQIAEDEPDPQKKKKKFMPKFMQNLFTPQMFLKEIQFDSVFTFEKIALGILQVIKQKDANIGGETQEPKKPRGANLAQTFANAMVSKQNRQPKKNRNNQTQTNLRLNDLEPSQLGKSLDLNAQYTQFNQSSTIQHNKQEKITAGGRRRVQSESKSNPQMFSPIQDKSLIYKMGKDSIRKHSVKKQKQAENQMMANIDFLRNMRGSPTESQKKQWKQETSQIKKTIQDVKQSKRKQLQALGFTDSSKLLHSKLASSQTYSPQRSDFLPQIRQSRKKGQIYKPTAFSVYTIQKDNEIFYNKFAK